VSGTIQRPLGRDFFRREAGVIDRVVLLLVLLAAWEVLVRATGLGGEFISTPIEIAPATVELLETEEIRSALAATARAVGAAYVICAFVGVFIGVVLGVSPRAHQVFAPILRILFATPKMVLVPVFILLFGLGFTGTFTFAVSLGIFPILLGTIDAVREVDSRYLTSARSLGCSRAALTWRVSLPCAFPAIVTALRIGLVQTTLGVLLAELYGAWRSIRSD
jgi:ABC-type nitrate/sulfonate/bicarbonate transport system permease component